MSGMRGNPCFEATNSEAKATLALAFEQRTANLLAFYAMIPTSAVDKATVALHQEILERLGLR